uniref:Aminotran_5 domain-containing protein n=1 Tax=Meloidogyne hapla TaxID=6305 RepID=A0A1I8BVS1_MELHA
MPLLEPKSITNNAVTEANERQWNNYFATSVRALSQAKRKEWLDQLKGVCMASESHFPGRECIDLAKQVEQGFGAKFVVTPSGGANDDEVCEACEHNDMVLVHTTQRSSLR